MTPKQTGIEVFGQTFGKDGGYCATFRTVKTQRRANLWVRWYTFLRFRAPHFNNAPLFFDSAPIGQGWF